KLGARGVLESLRETHAGLTGLLAHEHASLSLAQRCSGLPSSTPLFSSLLNYRHGATGQADSGIAWEGMQALGGEERTNFPMVMSVDDQGQGFQLSGQTVRQVGVGRICDYMLAAVECIVTALAMAPESAIGEMDLLATDERDQLYAWSVNLAAHADEKPVHHLIERRAREAPGATALLFGDESLSYAELNLRANRLAHHLIKLGVRPDVKVGIAVERSVEMVVGLLAIMKAGGAYVPLDPEYPADRLAYMIGDSGIQLLLTQSALKEGLPLAAGLRLLELDALDLAGEAGHDPAVALHGENLAYVIYTSGSTGRPKGAANRHRSLYSRLAWMQQAYGLTAADTVLQKTPFSFDVSVWEFFWPLMTGARLAVANPGDHRDPRRLVELIERHGVTTLHFVPSMLQAFLAHEGIEACASLTRVVCSGEALPAEARNGVFKRLPKAGLYNLYGPTEAAIDVTHSTCRDDGRGQVPIGRPISATHTHVLDAGLNLVPAGVAGELYLGGINLARGYLDRPGLSAERFVADPFGLDGERLYRTGDLVRWNDEGELEYLGRIDHQVKIRGFRIELGEVEAQLLAQPAVREAVVVAHGGAAGARLVAYVSAQAGQTIDTAALRARLGKALPDYMVPSLIVTLDSLPLNANGKVDRKALPEPDHESREYEAPQGEVEQALAAIWAGVLGVERVGRQDNFFELGGDSILSLKVISRSRANGLSLTPQQIFAHQTLAAVARAGEGDRKEESIPVLPETSRSGPMAASYAQVRQWFLWKLEPESAAYHISHALTLNGALDVDALKAAFEALLVRHESLRTVFRAGDDGQAAQLVGEASDAWFEHIDLTGTAADALTAQVRGEVARLNRTPFDLEHGPLLRVGLIREAADRHVLAVVMHHIVSDGWSMNIIVEEFVELYRARLEGRSATLAPLPVQYADYAAWQRQWMEAGERERQLSYWKAQLGDEHPVLQLPTNRPRKADGAYRAARHTFVLPPDLAGGLQRRAQAQGATLFMALLAGVQVLLSRHSGQSDIRVGVPIANRHRSETEGVVGFFVNTQVLRNVIDDRQSMAQVLEQAKQASLGAQAHQDLPFEQLVEALRPERQLGANPLFQVLMNHQRQQRGGARQLPGLVLEDYLSGDRTAQFELTVDTFEAADGLLHVGFTYAQELFAAEAIERMAAHYVAVLRALAEDPGRAAGAVSLLDEAERDRLRAWGVNPAAHADEKPVHHLIERRAREAPGATALLFGDESLSYAELNLRANRLAHHLIKLGVRPDVKVGIAVERSVEMVVGLLAIMKAGGAYVPLDPEYPADRLAYMIGDSGIQLLLTQSALKEGLPLAAGLRLLELDALDLAGEAGHDPAVALHGENLAYVIYTSGSTGRPKGAANRHRSLYSRLAWMQQAYGLTAADTVLQKTPFSFDVSVWEFFWPLMTGARLAVANPGDHRDPRRLVELIERHGVTTLHFVPSMLQAFLAHEGIEACASLTRVVCSGEALPAEARNGVFKRLPKAGLYNLYGPTEAAIDVTHSTCRDDGRGQVPIGRPISATHTHVLDAGLNLVPAGVAGELYLGGINLARGYLDRPGLSAERFVADPFGLDGERLYRTGDLVRWNDEGELEYLGRIDHQVKIRGFRIELGEVEAQLLAQPAVREAVVVAHGGATGARLVAYVSAQAGQPIDTAALRGRLGEALPDYMVPSLIVTLDSLPLNANGKVDRKALPEPGHENREYEAPQGEVEQALAAIWAGVLGVERIGRQDNFFELGGHSLLALSVLERMRARGKAVQVRTLFQQPVLAAFAQSVARDEDRRDVVVPPNLIPADCDAITPEMLTLIDLDLDVEQIARIEEAVPGGAANIQDIYPLAPLQEGILFHHMLQGEGDAYVTPHLLGFDSRERLERFVSSFNRVIARHDILRTAVLWEGLQSPVQVVARHAALVIEWLPVSQGTDAAERLNAHVDPLRHRIDVRRAPLLRAVALQDPDHERWLLQLPGHHLVLDHTTLELIVAEIALIQQGRAEELSEPVPFRRFVAQARLGVSAAEHEAFFKAMLADVDEPTAPFGLLDVQGDGGGVEELRLPLAAGLSERIRRQARSHGLGTASLFHLAWALVLSKATGKDDVVFGTVLFGRMQGGEGAGRALGMFINTLPLRVKLGGRGVLHSLRETHAGLIGLMAHEHASLSLAQRCSGMAGGTPLFSALLNYRHGASGTADSGAVWEGMVSLGGEERTNYPVGMSIDDLGQDFHLVGQAVRSVGAAKLCEYMLAAVEGIVEVLDGQSGRAIGELDLLGATERELLRTWSVNPASHANMAPVHQLFERWALESPLATALLFGDESLTYMALNQRANRLAHRLIKLGVG
ncbi:non-ribosomal peptide synthetase, partial [Duganella sp. CF517]|uniref:non-ribosomal peptide synthetase n=1 Tax=Duganella sp. CF517 TaxID=1881038 RepID=UPI001E448095